MSIGQYWKDTFSGNIRKDFCGIIPITNCNEFSKLFEKRCEFILTKSFINGKILMLKTQKNNAIITEGLLKNARINA